VTGRIFICLAALLPARAVFAVSENSDGSDRGGTVKVDVVVDMTEAGKKVAPPTPEQPAYYLPVFSGDEDVGYAPFFQRPLPPAPEVEKFIEKEFARQGYRPLVKGARPSLVLELAWGYMSPKWGPVPPGWIRTLLYGDTMDTIGFDGKPTNIRDIDDLEQEITERSGFYYVIVSAFDFRDALQHKATLLWRAHISTTIWGRYFDQVLPTMVMTAAPLLGRETLRPEVASAPVVPMGHVIVGTPVLKKP
jgi:hypothetical protein